MGCNACTRACAYTFADSPAYLVVDQGFAHTIELASATFLHGDSIIDGDTAPCSYPRGHTPRSNTCAVWGLVFDTGLASSLMKARFVTAPSGSAVSDADATPKDDNRVEVSLPEANWNVTPPPP